MTRLTGPMSATATRREPILICNEDSQDAVRAIEAAALLRDQVQLVPPPR